MKNPSLDSTFKPLIIAVGASAGGLDAFQELLSSLGDKPNVAIAFVQHLDPTSKSLLAELLTNTTSMSVVEISGRKKLKANTVYVCPPQTLLDLKNGFVSIANECHDERPASPIDHFFHAVAEDQGARGVGVILSGAGSDGTLGLKAISDRGGLTFAQDPVSAKYDSMPRSAATTGVADHVMRPREIAAELLQYARHLADSDGPASATRMQTDINEAIPAIAKRLMEVTQHNFQHYKTNTLTRRIQRRMQVLKIANASDYVGHMQHQEDEVRLLFRELLIGVTAFFRDSDAFGALKAKVLPKLFENRTEDDCVRIWVAGCSSGQEAYTMAMLCREVMDEVEASCDVQIFATDIDERALQVARTGTYPVGIEEQVAPQRLKRFFVKRGKKYHVTNEIRVMVLFSVHNLISDPPFSRQDLISCRNLLIYLGQHLQNKLIPLFHYALRPSGYLFLGPSENITSHGELFRALDAKQRISQRKGTAIRASGASQYRPSPMITSRGDQVEPDSGTDLTEMRQRITLDEFAPKSVVIDDDGQILNASADMQKYLTVSGGNYQNNIVKMAARGLRLGLRTAIAEAKKIRRRVEHQDLSIRVGKKVQRVMLTVQPMPRLGAKESLFMVVFHDIGKPFKRDDAGESVAALPANLDDDLIVTQLERELETTRDDLDKTLQDMEAANEELKSSNEELLSMNEELQSANEELETSREEIRAGSEAVGRANADLENLLRSIGIATIFLDDELCIRSFTPAAIEIYGLIPTDTGRPLAQIVPNVESMPPLPLPQSLVHDEAIEDTVTTHDGQSYIRRVLPYQDEHGDTSGMVVTFTDVSQLKESQELFQLLVEASAQIVWLTNAEGVVTEDSPSWRAFTGQSFQQFIGQGWLDAIHPDDREPTAAKWKQVLDSGQTYSVEYRLLHHSGDYRWTQVRAVAQRNVVGLIRRWVGMNTDINDRKIFEKELADAKDRLELSMSVSDIAPWSWDTENKTVVSNATLNRIFGFDENYAPSLDDFIGRIDEAARDRVSKAIAHSLETGDPYDEEYAVNWPNGEVRHVRARGNVRTDSQGVVEDFLGVVLDNTDRNAAEQILRETSRRMEMALRAGGMAAWEWTPEKSYWTKELYLLLGIDHEQQADTELFFSLVHPDDLDALKTNWQDSVDGKDSYDCEFRIIRPDGETRWVVGQGDVVRDDAGRIVRMYGVNWDCTQEHDQAAALRESERRAQAANASKSEFLANMSHEIRTPMTAILGYTDLLSEFVAADEAKEHLQTIRRNGDYLLEIINDILDLSKIEAGKFEMEEERFDPTRVIEDVRSIMDVRARESGLELTVEYDGKLPPIIQSDAKRIKQILINLVGNAIKFTREGRVRIRVWFEQPTYQLHFDIIDTGIGMSQTQLDRLFQPFTQGDSSVTRHFGGTGLGLAISKRLAELLGGQISVSSTESVGSTFAVAIATGGIAEDGLVRPTEQVAAKKTKPRSLEPIELTCHVLVVDDRRDIRFLSKHILTEAGATVNECEDGQLAVDHIKRCLQTGDLPDLIVLDMQMPNLDGYQTARQLRTLGFTGPIIALTADAMQGDMNECLEAGCNDYLPKPIDNTLMLEKVAEMLKA